MMNGRKNNLKHLSVWFLLVGLLIVTSAHAGNYHPSHIFCNTLTPLQDGSRPVIKSDTIPRKDSVTSKTDTFSVKTSKDSLDAPVNYSASDSMVLDVPNKKIILYSKGKVVYKDMTLTADSIEMDQSTNIITAVGKKDTSGRIAGRPKMVQKESTLDADIIKYNFKTQRGITQNTITEQGGMYFQGERFKKGPANDYYGYHGIITTCNYDVPHFGFRTNKMKLVNQKLAISGPIHPEFEGVPIPVYLPFGFFPISQGRHSGLLPPQFTASEQFGLGLEGLGYYKVLNDNFDVTLRTNLYSYGGWAAFLTPTYRVRYRYSGSMNLSIQSSRVLSTDPKQEYTTTQTFNITWAHVVDSKARPGTTFSASVNAGSTKYNQFVYNNPTMNYTNQLYSTIAYSKTWKNYNLMASANHNQNNNTQVINLSLPNVAFTVNTLYPFQKKDFVGSPKWYQKLGIGLSSNVANQVSVYEKEFNLRKIIDTMQWGAQHNIPIQLSLPPVGPIQIAPGVSLQQKWYSRRLTLRYDSIAHKVDTSIQKGFYMGNDVAFSIGMSTALFGTFTRFGKNSAMQAIRHTVRPTLSFSYRPDLASGSYYTTRVDSLGHTQRFSYYSGTMFGPFSEGTFGGISFGIDNNIEAKVRSKKDSADGGLKKIRLIDGFGFNGSYNLVADSFKLSTINIYARSTLFEKINITAGATLDPYQVDKYGYRMNKYMWSGGRGFSPGRITGGNIAISSSFQSKQRNDKKQPSPQDKNKNDNNLPPMTMEEQMAQLAYVRRNPAEFADFNIPWSLNVQYSLNFSRQFKPDYSGFETVTTQSFNWTGDFSITPKWKAGMSGFFDFVTRKIPTLTMYLSREMHCWQMSINVTPVGLYRTFNITINPKSGILRDLRINRTRYFYGQ